MPIAAVDLFCGIGGLSKGLSLAGINVVAGVELEQSCKFAYEANNDAIFVNKDITILKAEELISLYPEHTIKILAGCAPCQPFSIYTKRYRKDGHTGHKWQLLNSFSHLIEETLPEIVTMENVPQLEREEIFQAFISRLVKLEYKIHVQIVYCPDYGVPQNRKRLVVLASRLGKISMIPPLYTPNAYLTVRNAIGNLPPLEDGDTDAVDNIHSCSRLSPINKRRIQESVPGGTWRDWSDELKLKCHLKSTGRSYPSVYGRMVWDEPSPTITTQFYGYGNGRFGHPDQDRGLSLREGALLQSFPPNYIFMDKDHSLKRRQIGTQIGNAVPVELGRAIGISILNHIKEVNGHG